MRVLFCYSLSSILSSFYQGIREWERSGSAGEKKRKQGRKQKSCCILLCVAAVIIITLPSLSYTTKKTPAHKNQSFSTHLQHKCFIQLFKTVLNFNVTHFPLSSLAPTGLFVVNESNFDMILIKKDLNYIV